MVVVACLITVSSLAQICQGWLGLVRLVNRSAKARFGHVGDQVSQVKDQVGQGQGQEFDNKFFYIHDFQALMICLSDGHEHSAVQQV